jgi:hypothetical protein
LYTRKREVTEEEKGEIDPLSSVVILPASPGTFDLPLPSSKVETRVQYPKVYRPFPHSPVQEKEFLHISFEEEHDKLLSSFKCVKCKEENPEILITQLPPPCNQWNQTRMFCKGCKAERQPAFWECKQGHENKLELAILPNDFRTKPPHPHKCNKCEEETTKVHIKYKRSPSLEKEKMDIESEKMMLNKEV